MYKFLESLVFLFFASIPVVADSYIYNSYNNHGSIGLINIPTARFMEESVYAFTFYDGDPDQKITFTSNPYEWLEASFFYTNIDGKRPIGFSSDYKDKGFNFKIRLKEEGSLPSLALGVYDIGGTGLYGSEYLVSSYGINNVDFHLGIGWGELSGRNSFRNPFTYLNDGFNSRSFTQGGSNFQGTGDFRIGDFFSGEKASLFYGISYVPNEKFILKIESDSIKTPGKIGYDSRKSDLSYGIEYKLASNFTLGFFSERGVNTSLRFNYKNNAKSYADRYEYQPANDESNNNLAQFIKNLEANDIGVNKIYENNDFLGIQLTQYTHSNLDVIEEIIRSASFDADIEKPILKELRIADLKGMSEYDSSLTNNSLLRYKKNDTKNRFSSKTYLSFRPYIASREEFFKGALLIENNNEYIIKDNFIFSSNLKYSIVDNFDDLKIPPITSYPAQVRSDVKDYLRNFSDGIFIGRAQIDYYKTIKTHHHFMITAGILEEMFNGIGFEYLYFKQNSNYAFGFEIFDVKKRDYQMRFGTLDYKNISGSANFYYRNYDVIPFDAKLSYGEYLAGDEGVTFELSRSFLNGTKFGAFASFTDVSSEQFGEGAFDKGIFFSIPIYGNFVNYSWRPLTKDPGAKLNRKHTLHDLLIKFRPYNY